MSMISADISADGREKSLVSQWLHFSWWQETIEIYRNMGLMMIIIPIIISLYFCLSFQLLDGSFPIIATSVAQEGTSSSSPREFSSLAEVGDKRGLHKQKWGDGIWKARKWCVIMHNTFLREIRYFWDPQIHKNRVLWLANVDFTLDGTSDNLNSNIPGYDSNLRRQMRCN